MKNLPILFLKKCPATSNKTRPTTRQYDQIYPLWRHMRKKSASIPTSVRGYFYKKSACMYTYSTSACFYQLIHTVIAVCLIKFCQLGINIFADQDNFCHKYI
jgi:hypothetical protein